MSISPSQEGNYQAKENAIIFYEGQNTNSINILMQGKMEVYISTLENFDGLDEADILENSYKLFNIGKNIFTGANDLFQSGKYSFSFKAIEDCTLHTFMAHNTKLANTLVHSHNDFGAYILTSISNLINSSYSTLVKLEQHNKTLNILANNLILAFWLLKEQIGFSTTPSSSFFRNRLDILNKMRDTNFSFPTTFDSDFFEADHSEIEESEYKPASQIIHSRIEYYKHLSNLPPDLLKSFFNADPFITEYHIKMASDLMSELQSELKDSFKIFDTQFKQLFLENKDCVFSEYIKAAFELQDNNSDYNLLLHTLDYLSGKIKEISVTFKNEYEYKVQGIEQIEIQCESLKSSSDLAGTVGRQNTEAGTIPDELRDSAKKILSYSGLPRERCELFMKNLESFRNLKDKLSLDIDSRNIRSNISSVFYEAYEAVLKKVLKEKNNSVLFNMFLTYSYMDEKLLSPQHTISLYEMAGKTVKNPGNVYNIKDWLIQIYNMEKDPSINEFGMDYFDVFREMNKRKETSNKEKFDYNNNIDGRLNFEINNMFKTNHRICYGQISTYFPILHNDMITRDLTKAIVTPELLIESIRKILEVDFSAFYREINYRNPEKNIEKEYIMKSIIPDFILIPIFGTRSIMWQELSGRNRSTPGRILLPIFTTENLYDLMVKMIGNLRWELCRTMMGVAWNDITDKSLTSEYTDYIQFYRKNRDLSEEAKEKLKGQLQKYNNKMRDIFTHDYETWINYESKGAVRLNKVARGIIFRYCPFSKSIREQLEKSPLFSDIAIPFKNVRAKQARELESKYQKFSKSGPIDAELEENLRFYKEM